MEIISTITVGLLGALVPLVLWLIDHRAKKLELKNQKVRIEDTEEQLRIARRAMPDNLEVIENVSDVLQNSVLMIIRRLVKKKKDIIIENFGLDLETVIPWINTNIVHAEEFADISFNIRSLIINPESKMLKHLINGESNITATAVTASISGAENFNRLTKLHKFKFVIKQYDQFPMFHGFIINHEDLFIGFTHIDKGKLIGGAEPYLHVSKGESNPARLTKHYFRFFTDWFNYYWEISKEVVNVNK